MKVEFIVNADINDERQIFIQESEFRKAKNNEEEYNTCAFATNCLFAFYGYPDDFINTDEYEKIFTELEKIAIVQSVKSSNAIEGIITSDERIKEIVNQNSKPLNHNEKEIAGYRDVLNEIHLHYEDIEFNEDTILKLHEIMMSYTGVEDAGKYKVNQNYVIEEDTQGNRKVRFKPLEPKETPIAMEQLVLAYNDACNNININQLLLIPCVILDFLCIHPFRDGNGRMSRLLTLLLL